MCPSEITACGLMHLPSGVFMKGHLCLWHWSGFSGDLTSFDSVPWPPIVERSCESGELRWPGADAARNARRSAGAGDDCGFLHQEENLSFPHPQDLLRSAVRMGLVPLPPPSDFTPLHENP